jgi:hypothetical protein
MRLGLLGPAPDQKEVLADAARKMQKFLRADRVLYLGSDRVLDLVVGEWAEELVGPGADDLTIMRRATEHCLHAEPATIDAFLHAEHERSRLRMFQSLAGERTRSVELIGGKVAVMLYDKAHLEEEDILPATLLIFGKSREPLMKLIGRRWFLSPGMFPQHGIMVIDDADENLSAIVYDSNCEEVGRKELAAPKMLRMRVAGDS